MSSKYLISSLIIEKSDLYDSNKNNGSGSSDSHCNNRSDRNGMGNRNTDTTSSCSRRESPPDMHIHGMCNDTFLTNQSTKLDTGTGCVYHSFQESKINPL